MSSGRMKAMRMTLESMSMVVALAALVAVMAAGVALSGPAEEDGMETDTSTRKRPAIDLAAPAEIETATFGLG